MIADTTQMENVVIECRSLSKSFGGLRAVDNVSIPIVAERITALTGPNGAGKTTVFHMITGSLRPDQGDVLYRGRVITGLPPWRIARLGIGRLFQDVRVFRKLTVLENMLVAFQEQLGESPANALFHRVRVLRQDKDNTSEAFRLLEFVGLQEYRSSYAEQLSYGQQKLLALARLLAARSDCLLLDEPTAGVHVETAHRLLSALRLLTELGTTVIMIEHNAELVLEFADDIIVMDKGQIIQSA